MLEERIIRDEDRIQVLEKELEVTILFGEEADRKYEEVGRLTNATYRFYISMYSAWNCFRFLFNWPVFPVVPL